MRCLESGIMSGGGQKRVMEVLLARTPLSMVTYVMKWPWVIMTSSIGDWDSSRGKGAGGSLQWPTESLCFPKSTRRTLIPKVMVFEGGAFGRLGHEISSWMVLVPFKGGPRECPCALPRVRTHSEGCLGTRNWVLPNILSADVFILDPHSPRTMKNKYLLFKPFGLWRSVTAAWRIQDS